MPDLLGLVREASILCSSTTPTLPFGVHTAAEHLPMTVLNHGLSWSVPGDVELVRERILEARMAAEGPLHELGAIAIVNSDSQGMGRIGETVRRTFQLAHVMKAWRRSGAADGVPGLPADPGLDDPDDRDDTARVLRYLAKITIEPAITHGLADHVGSLRPGRLADLALWEPAFFGVKPEWVFKAGFPAWGPMGDGNASLERAEPTRYRADWGGVATAAPKVAVTFVSRNVDVAVLARRLGTRRTLVPVGGVRGLTRDSLHANRATAPVEIDVRTGAVTPRRPATGGRSGVRGAPQPPLPAAIGPPPGRRGDVRGACKSPTAGRSVRASDEALGSGSKRKEPSDVVDDPRHHPRAAAWLLGLIGGIGGALIHGLLILAAIVLVAQLASGRGNTTA